MPRLVLVATVVSGVLASASPSAAQTFPTDLPLAIICFHEQNQGWIVGYLEVVKADGSAVYGRGQLSANLNAERVVEPPANRTAALDCYGKSLNQWRASGRLVDLQPGK